MIAMHEWIQRIVVIEGDLAGEISRPERAIARKENGPGKAECGRAEPPRHRLSIAQSRTCKTRNQRVVGHQNVTARLIHDVVGGIIRVRLEGAGLEHLKNLLQKSRVSVVYHLPDRRELNRWCNPDTDRLDTEIVG